MSNRFLRLLWKFNNVTFAVLSLLGIFICLFAAYHIARDVFRTPYRLTDAARVTAPGRDDAGIATQLDIQGFRKIAGTNVLFSPVVGDQTYAYRLSSKGVASTRNWIFFDLATGKSSALLPDNDRLVVEASELRPENAESNTPPRALLFAIIDTDSNRDGMLDRDDNLAYALTAPDGSGLTRLEGIRGAARGQHVDASGSALTLITKDGGKVTAHTIDLAAFKVTRTAEISP